MNAELISKERKEKITWGIMLLIGAMGSASLRNNPALGIMPFAVGVIDALIFGCILCAVCLSDWRTGAAIAVILPLYLWVQRFLDGYMVPVRIAVNLTMVGCMYLCGRLSWNLWKKTALIAVSACLVMFVTGTMMQWAVKHEHFIRAIIVSWNTDLYCCVSIFAATIGALLLTGESIRAAKK